MGKLEGKLSPDRDTATPGQRGRQCGRHCEEALPRSFLAPPPPPRVQIASLEFKGSGDECFSLEKGGVEEDLNTLFLAARTGPMQRPKNRQKMP